MRIWFIILVIFLKTGHSYAQFGIIRDTDGYTNIRDGHRNLISRLYNHQLFSRHLVNEDIKSQNTIAIEYPLYSKNIPHFKKYSNDQLKDGYIHESRIIWLNELPPMKKNRLKNNRGILFSNDSIQLTIRIGYFDQSKHKKIMHKDGYVLSIDGYMPFGIDGDISPGISEIVSITYTCYGKKTVFKKKNYAGLYAINLNRIEANIGPDGYLYLVMNNSDGAGSYSAAWAIKNGEPQYLYIPSPL